jgi:hypothetical protein
MLHGKAVSSTMLIYHFHYSELESVTDNALPYLPKVLQP